MLRYIFGLLGETTGGYTATYYTFKAGYTPATKLNSTVDFVESRQSRPCCFGPVHTDNKVDRIGNKVERIGNNVETS